MTPEIAALIVFGIGLLAVLGWQLFRPMRSKRDGGSS